LLSLLLLLCTFLGLLHGRLDHTEGHTAPAQDKCAKYTKCSSIEDCKAIGKDVCVLKFGCGRICA
jgi:hypothetical protein